MRLKVTVSPTGTTLRSSVAVNEGAATLPQTASNIQHATPMVGQFHRNPQIFSMKVNRLFIINSTRESVAQFSSAGQAEKSRRHMEAADLLEHVVNRVTVAGVNYGPRASRFRRVITP
jgi:hypothetical protein